MWAQCNQAISYQVLTKAGPIRETVGVRNSADNPDVNPARDRTTLIGWIMVVGLALPFLVLLIQQLTEISDRRLPCCDYSALELGTRAFLRGEQLTGMYSREGWRHPGPITFVWSSIARLLPGRGFAEHQVAAVAVHMAAFGIVLWALRKRLSNTSFIVAVAVSTIFVFRFDIDQFREPWNPFTAMSWTMATVVIAATFVSRGGWKWLIAFVAVASFATQTHVGAAPVVLLASLWVAKSVYDRWSHEGRRSALLGAGGVCLLLWILPVIDQIFGDGNLFDVASGTDRGWASGDIWSTFIRLIGAGPSAMGRYFGPSSPYIEASPLSVMEVAIAVIAIGLGVIPWRRRKASPLLFAMSSMSWIGVVATTVLLQTTSGPFYRYLLAPVAGLSAVIWLSGIVAAVELMESRLRDEFVIGVAVAMTAVCSVLAAVGVDATHLVSRYTSETIERAVADIEVKCSRLPSPLVVEVPDDVDWTEALPMVVALDRCTTVRVVGVAGFIAGPGYEADDDALPNYVLGVTG